MAARAQDQLFLDWERTAQGWVLERPRWMTFWNAVYQWLYWMTVRTILALLWFRDRARYFLLRNTLIVAAGIGLVIWAAFPVAPPRFMGYVDTPALTGDRLVAERSGWVNRYAAVPSFHVGWPAIAAYVVADGSGSSPQRSSPSPSCSPGTTSCSTSSPASSSWPPPW